jgi:putative holliday junction resolvase
MGRYMAIDYGSKRVGVAVTDPSNIIATGLTTVHSTEIISFIKGYLLKEKVDAIVVGEPLNLRGGPTHATPLVNGFIKTLEKEFPGMKIVRLDERFTSSIARAAMIQGGVKKSDRRKKELLDEMSATLLLQDYLESLKLH